MFGRRLVALLFEGVAGAFECFALDAGEGSKASGVDFVEDAIDFVT
jgi:hypothetical protein